MVRCVEEEESDEQYLPQPVPGDIRLDHLTDSQQSQVTRSLYFEGIF